MPLKTKKTLPLSAKKCKPFKAIFLSMNSFAAFSYEEITHTYLLLSQPFNKSMHIQAAST